MKAKVKAFAVFLTYIKTKVKENTCDFEFFLSLLQKVGAIKVSFQKLAVLDVF